MIFNFECFPAVAGHAHAWIFDLVEIAHANVAKVEQGFMM